MIRLLRGARHAAASSSRTSTAPRSIHLGRGLFEAHARDEAGFEDEAGHKQMWFAARDIAFETPVTEDETQLMLAAHGHRRGPGATPPPPPRSGAARRHRRQRSSCSSSAWSRLLLIEISRVPHVRAGPRTCCPTPTSSPATARRPASCRTSAPTRRRTSTYLQDRAVRDARPHDGSATSRQEATTARDMIGALGTTALAAVARRRPRASAASRSVGEVEHWVLAVDTRRQRTSSLDFHELGLETSRASEAADEVRHLLRAPAAAAVGRRQRAAADPGRARAGRAGRQARHPTYVWEVEHHFLEEYSHSSAPEVFLAAASQRTQEHPPRPRHHPDRAGLQPPGPHRRARRDARPRVERPRRVRLGRVVVARPSSAASGSIRCSSARCGSRGSRSRSGA